MVCMPPLAKCSFFWTWAKRAVRGDVAGDDETISCHRRVCPGRPPSHGVGKFVGPLLLKELGIIAMLIHADRRLSQCRNRADGRGQAPSSSSLPQQRPCLHLAALGEGEGIDQVGYLCEYIMTSYDAAPQLTPSAMWAGGATAGVPPWATRCKIASLADERLCRAPLDFTMSRALDFGHSSDSAAPAGPGALEGANTWTI